MSHDDIHSTHADPVALPPTPPLVPASIPEPPPSGDPEAEKEAAVTPVLPTEILPPTAAILRTGIGKPAGRPSMVMAALTSEALWIQETWALRRLPLSGVTDIDLAGASTRMVLTFGSDAPPEKIEFTFATVGQREQWAVNVQARKQSTDPEEADAAQPAPSGVTLILGSANVPHRVLGEVTFTDHSSRQAGWGLRLRAGMMGANAVIEVVSRKCSDLGFGRREFRGLAICVEDDDAAKRLRMRSYRQQVSSLFNRCMVLIVIQAVLTCLAAMQRAAGQGDGLDLPNGETRSETMESLGYGIGALYAWPITMLMLFRLLQWPRLIGVTGLTVLAVTTLRGGTVIAAHLLAIATTGATLEQSKFWYLFDPIDIAFIIYGGILCARAWGLANESRQLLPPELQLASPAHKSWSRVLLAASSVYVLFVLGWIGWYRYEASVYLLHPGVDVKREQEALLALTEGVDQSQKGDLSSAERSFRRALKLWEELTERLQTPPVYRRNLATTLADLGGTLHRQGRLEEAKQYYARSLAIAGELAGDPAADNDFKLHMASIRRSLAELEGKSANSLEEKDRAARRKFEEAQVKAAAGDAAAERLYQECISAWEEILKQTTDQEYRRATVVNLATAFAMLGEFQTVLGKHSEAEASLRKAIKHGEQALAVEADRPLIRNNLEVARRLLVTVREQSHQKAIDKLCDAQNFAEAVALFRRGIAEAEEQLHAGNDRELAAAFLAYRLERFAWFLGHNPMVQDTKAAVGYARRATELQPAVGNYRFTLGMVQYRNGDWLESLASLEKLRTMEGAQDGYGLLLIAMNRHRLGQRPEAVNGLRAAVEWINKRRQEAEKDAVLSFSFEKARPSLDALRQEAENLINGKPRID
jgi:tetratricopeptide (TPR) repeat protein